jgi:hypothetical protein
MIIIEVLAIGRAEVLHQLNIRKPIGRRYNRAMGDWLVENNFRDLHKGTRSDGFKCRENRAAIERWRARLTEPERLSYTHPSTVLRKWKKVTNIPDPNASQRVSAYAQLREAKQQLQEENNRMRREIERGGGDLWESTDRPEDIARVLFSRITWSKLERIWRVLRQMHQQRTAAAKGQANRTVELE